MEGELGLNDDFFGSVKKLGSLVATSCLVKVGSGFDTGFAIWACTGFSNSLTFKLLSGLSFAFGIIWRLSFFFSASAELIEAICIRQSSTWSRWFLLILYWASQR